MWVTSEQTLTFLVQTLFLIKNNELAVFVSLLQDVLALLDVAVVVFQAKEGGHEGHVGLNGSKIRAGLKTKTHIFKPTSIQTVCVCVCHPQMSGQVTD